MLLCDPFIAVVKSLLLLVGILAIQVEMPEVLVTLRWDVSVLCWIALVAASKATLTNERSVLAELRRVLTSLILVSFLVRSFYAMTFCRRAERLAMSVMSIF
jgi:hypothetical protein